MFETAFAVALGIVMANTLGVAFAVLSRSFKGLSASRVLTIFLFIAGMVFLLACLFEIFLT